MNSLALWSGSITDVVGITVGHETYSKRPTGCSVVIAREGAVTGIDVRGAAPGTRETDLLSPENMVQEVHAILLSGGSAWGLDAASGVMRWLEEENIGLKVGSVMVPIVPAAVLFDLNLGDASIRPDFQAGYRACQNSNTNGLDQGNVGAGAGAMVGKIFGFQNSMRGGIGTASMKVNGITVGALVACNAMGDVIDPMTGQLIAGSRNSKNEMRHSHKSILEGEKPTSLLAGTNTTIGVIATDAKLTKVQAQRLAQAGHDGLARSIYPVHTQLDGEIGRAHV